MTFGLFLFVAIKFITFLFYASILLCYPTIQFLLSLVLAFFQPFQIPSLTCIPSFNLGSSNPLVLFLSSSPFLPFLPLNLYYSSFILYFFNAIFSLPLSPSLPYHSFFRALTIRIFHNFLAFLSLPILSCRFFHSSCISCPTSSQLFFPSIFHHHHPITSFSCFYFHLHDFESPISQSQPHPSPAH